jgi:hypothetical protein
MLPLAAWSEYCPNDCDRKVEPEPVKLPGWPAHNDDFSDEEITLDLGPIVLDKFEDEDVGNIDWSDLMDADVSMEFIRICSRCGSTNTEAFPNCNNGDWHCVACGHLWYK